MDSEQVYKQIDLELASPPAPSGEFTACKNLNRKISLLRWMVRDFSVPTMPMRINISLSGKCNLQCSYCPVHGEPSQHKLYNSGELDFLFEELSALAEDFLPCAYEFWPSNAGEIFVFPEAERLMELTSYYDSKLYVLTNGTHFPNRLLAKIITTSVFIGISLCGASQFVCETLHRGMNYKRFVNNVRKLTRSVELMQENLRPTVEFCGPVLGSTIREMPLQVELGHVLGVHGVRKNPINLHPFEWLEENYSRELLAHHKSYYNAYYSLAKDVGDRLGMRTDFPPPFKDSTPDDSTLDDTSKMFIKKIPEGLYENFPSFSSYLDHERIERDSQDIVREALAFIDARKANEEIQEKSNELYYNLYDTYIDLLKTYQDDLVSMAAKREFRIPFCISLFENVGTGLIRNVFPCCTAGRPVLGTFNGKTLREVYNGEKYNDFRTKFTSSDQPQVCRNCYLAHNIRVEVLLGKLFKDAKLIWGIWRS